MSTDAKNTSKSKERASRRVDCLQPEAAFPIPDIYAEKSPIDRGDDDSLNEPPPERGDSPGIDKSAGFNPYDTGSLYKK